MRSVYNKILLLGGAALLTAACQNSGTNSYASPSTHPDNSPTNSAPAYSVPASEQNQQTSGSYEEFKQDYNDEDVKFAVHNMQYMMANNSKRRFAINNYFADFENRKGPIKAMNMLLIAGRSSDMPMPTASEYEDYKRAYYEQFGVNVSSWTPQQMADARFGHKLDPLFFDVSNPAGIVFLVMHEAGKAIDPSDFEKHMETWSLAQNKSGYIEAFKNSSGHYPRDVFEFDQARQNVIREDQQSTYGSTSYVKERRSGSITGETRTREFNPLQTPGDPRSIIPRQNANENQREMSRQIDRGTQQQLQRDAERTRQMINQGANQVGGQVKGTLDNILKPKKDKQ